MRHFILAAMLLALSACGDGPAQNTGSTGAASERDNPSRFLKVNYQVRRNLVGKKVVEGEVINTGKFQTWNTVTLRITAIKEGNESSVAYTISEAVAPGGKADFKFKPEGNPDRVTVAVSGATAE